MYLQFANGELSPEKVASRYASGVPEGESRTLAESFASGEASYDVEDFRGDFKRCVEDFIDNGPIKPVVAYLDSYMSIALEEVELHVGKGSFGTTSRYALIKDASAPWLEAVICYNFCLYIKAFGREDLKCCKACKRLFANKGKYAKYCSDSCKGRKDN